MLNQSAQRLFVVMALAVSGWGWATTRGEAIQALNEGDSKTAVNIAVALKTSDGYALAAKAMTYGAVLLPEKERKAAYEQAENYAREAIELDSKNTDGYMELARAMGRKAQYVGVLESIPIAPEIRRNLETAIKLDPKNASAYIGLGLWHAEIVVRGALVASSLGANEGEVRPNVEKALALEPETIVHRLEYANSLLKFKDRRNKPKYLNDAKAQLNIAINLPAKTFWDKRNQEAARKLLSSL